MVQSIPRFLSRPGETDLRGLSACLRLWPSAVGPGPGLLGAWLPGRTWPGAWTVVGKSTGSELQKEVR
jgi:hypothetical protein